ncbi:CZB domain-containing protein [Sulfurimonas sp.]|uniref:CZB domain-containing protein n=1 Tax=Sulfurimonas sp. TaxID=2022749 RepID=UPI003D0C5B66
MTILNNAFIMQEITQAKIAHVRWVKRAEHLIAKLPVDKEFIPLEATSCGFGKWLYSSGTELRNMDDYAPIMEKIESLHDQLHAYYAEIYKLYFIIPENRSILHKVFTFNSKKVSKHEEELAKEIFEKLQVVSIELLEALNDLKIEIKRYK